MRPEHLDALKTRVARLEDLLTTAWLQAETTAGELERLAQQLLLNGGDLDSSNRLLKLSAVLRGTVLYQQQRMEQ